MKDKNPRLPEINPGKPDELLYDLPFEEYLADNTCVSSSGLKKVAESPLHFLWHISGEVPDEDTEPLRFGRAAHMMILEPEKFRELYVVQPDFGAMQSPKNKAIRDEWRAGLPADAVIVTQKDLDSLTYMVESLMSHPQASNFFKAGRPEVTGKFTDPTTGIRCRIRPDYLTQMSDGGLFLFDLKTTRMDTKGLFANDAAKRKYPMQLAFYRDGIAQITKKQLQAVALVAIEKNPPYSCWVYWLTEEDLAVGSAWNKKQLLRLKDAIENDKWEPPQPEGEILNMPSWFRTESFYE